MIAEYLAQVVVLTIICVWVVVIVMDLILVPGLLYVESSEIS